MERLLDGVESVGVGPAPACAGASSTGLWTNWCLSSYIQGISLCEQFEQGLFRSQRRFFSLQGRHESAGLAGRWMAITGSPALFRFMAYNRCLRGLLSPIRIDGNGEESRRR